eukprot:5593158-Pleurochrysis_carterae.AAC.2
MGVRSGVSSGVGFDFVRAKCCSALPGACAASTLNKNTACRVTGRAYYMMYDEIVILKLQAL